MNHEMDRTQRMMACLAEASRFRVVTRLMAQESCVTELARAVGLSQSCTTRHLQALERAGLVVGTRAGKRVVFRLRTDEPLVAVLVGLARMPEAAAEESRPSQVYTDHPHPTAAEAEAPPLPAEPPEEITRLPRRVHELEDFLL